MVLTFHATNVILQSNTYPPSFTGRTLPFTSSKLFKQSPTHRTSLVLRSSLVQDQEISFTDEENQLVDALIGIQGRGRSASPQQLNGVEQAVKVLEGLQGVPDPVLSSFWSVSKLGEWNLVLIASWLKKLFNWLTGSSLIEGRWQLMFTTRPGTASPIQRTFVGVDFFSVFQEISLQTNDPRVTNIVKFSETIGELKVEAAASIRDGKRILFRFDRAAFSFKFLPFQVPYPVPFRLLGDEVKGWLDTTYLSRSGNLRISRGSKGTTFVLQKKTEPRQRLLTAISTGTGVREAIDEFISLNRNVAKDEQELMEGEWQMIWSSQLGKRNRKVETDSWLENAGNGLMGKQIVKKNGQLKFLVDIVLGLRFSMTGTFVKSGANTYDVTMDDAAIIAGPFGYPIEMERKINLQLLYSDEKIRITRGYNDILFVHILTDGLKQK